MNISCGMSGGQFRCMLPGGDSPVLIQNIQHFSDDIGAIRERINNMINEHKTTEYPSTRVGSGSVMVDRPLSNASFEPIIIAPPPVAAGPTIVAKPMVFSDLLFDRSGAPIAPTSSTIGVGGAYMPKGCHMVCE